MSVREQTTTLPLGRPKVGDLTTRNGAPAVPIHYGAGVVEWVYDEQDGRDRAAAFGAAANILGSLRDRGALSGEDDIRHPEPTALQAAIPAQHHVPGWAHRPPAECLLVPCACGRDRLATDAELAAALTHPEGDLVADPETPCRCPAPDTLVHPADTTVMEAQQ